jgi:hypothetical protein
MCDAILDAQVSLFCGSHAPEPIATLSIGQALERIRDGQYRRQVEYLQRVLAHRGKSAYDRAKAYLPAVTFGGTFVPKRGNAYLRQHSGIVHFDIDNLIDITAIKRNICSDPRTIYVFASPSAVGLKGGVHIPGVEDDAAYKHSWRSVKDEYEQLYGVRWDPSGKDVSRLCYLSYDPELYINPHAEVFDVPPPPPPDPRPYPQEPSARRAPIDYHDYAARAIHTAVQMIQAAPLGTRHHTRLKAARLLGGYVAGGLLTDDQAYGALAQVLPGYTEDLASALKTLEDGLAYGKAHPITPEDLEAERQRWINTHRTPSPPTHQAPVDDDSWAGRRTLPLQPYRGLRLGRTVRHG